MTVSFKSQCEPCTRGEPIGWSKRTNRPVHSIYGTDENGKKWAMKNEFVACKNYDEECRWLGAPLGWHTFAWLPTKCRNGKWRWLTWVERHTNMLGRTFYTLGNRAH